MISRLSASAAFFAVLATASIAYAADVQQQTQKAPSVQGATMDAIVLPAVVVTGKRAAR